MKREEGGGGGAGGWGVSVLSFWDQVSSGHPSVWGQIGSVLGTKRVVIFQKSSHFTPFHDTKVLILMLGKINMS